VEAAGEAEGDGECGGGVVEDVAEGVVGDFFDDVAGGVTYGSDGADLVGDELVGLAVFDHLGPLEPHEEVV